MYIKFNTSLMATGLHRIHFFAKQVKMQEWKNSMSGKNEDRVIKLFESLGYQIGKDYQRQYGVGERYVIDFAFVNEKFAIEADGDSHLQKQQRAKDKIRDSYLRSNGWVTLRILDKELFGYKMSFFKNLIKEVVEERRAQYEKGVLYPIDFTKFNESDYE